MADLSFPQKRLLMIFAFAEETKSKGFCPLYSLRCKKIEKNKKTVDSLLAKGLIEIHTKTCPITYRGVSISQFAKDERSPYPFDLTYSITDAGLEMLQDKTVFGELDISDAISAKKRLQGA